MMFNDPSGFIPMPLDEDSYSTPPFPPNPTDLTPSVQEEKEKIFVIMCGMHVTNEACKDLEYLDKPATEPYVDWAIGNGYTIPPNGINGTKQNKKERWKQ